MQKKIVRVSTIPDSINIFFKGFLRELSNEYDVLVVSSPGKALDEISTREGVRTCPVQMQRRISVFKDFISLIKLICVFIKEKPDMVHSITPKAGLLSMLAAWITRVPVRVHTFTGLVFPTSTGLKRKILILMDKLICACATYINPEGRGVANDLAKFGITRKPLHIIANGNIRGVDMGHYSRTPDVMSLTDNIVSKDMFTFCFVGRLVGDKGINELVVAFNKLSKESQSIRLILVGAMEPTLDPLDESTIALMNTNERIIQAGHQSDIRPWLAASNAFVFPSYREGFPNVVLEACAMEIPCIVTNINGSNEIIIDGVNGEIIPSKDVNSLYSKMKDWYLNPSKVKGYASNSRGIIEEKFKQSIIWEATLNVYKELLK